MLFYVDGAIISVDDWEWVNDAKDLPFKQKVHRGVAWVATTAAALPHRFVLVTRKRLRDPITKRLESRALTFTDVARTIASMPHRFTTLTCGRGFTTHELAETCTLCGVGFIVLSR